MLGMGNKPAANERVLMERNTAKEWLLSQSAVGGLDPYGQAARG